MDVFSEYLVKRQKSTRDKLAIAGFILLGLLFTAFVLIYLLPMVYYIMQPLVSIVFPVWAIAMWGVLILTKRYNIEFEYTLTGSDLDIDKIINRKKRKRVLSTSVRRFDIVAPVLSDKYTDEYKSLITVDCSKNADKASTYFAVYTKDNQKKCLIFDPSKKMLGMIKTFCPDKFFEA